MTLPVPQAQPTGTEWVSREPPSVHAGMWHSGALVQGNVLIWGQGKGGRLGLGDEELRLAPTQLAMPTGALPCLCAVCLCARQQRRGLFTSSLAQPAR